MPAARADRNNQTPADIQLLFELIWRSRCSGCDGDSVEGSFNWTSQAAVGTDHANIGMIRFDEIRPGEISQFRHALDRDDLLRKFRQYSSGVAAARTDFQHFAGPVRSSNWHVSATI